MIKSFSHSVYFAPRGRKRLMELGNNLAQRYLSPEDFLIGFVGDAGAGKSVLINGMFPGLTLTNDDLGINIRPLPLLEHFSENRFTSHTYHVDIRFESAFHQPWELVEAVIKALRSNRRVIVEHFDLIADQIGLKPQVLIGIGEEVLITRPGLFGPVPEEIKNIVYKSLRYRKMAHTAEDLTSLVIDHLGFETPPMHSDVRSGFILHFDELPDFNIEDIQAGVEKYIAEDLPVTYIDDGHIALGDTEYSCTGPRVHVRRTGDIRGFRLLPDFFHDPQTRRYLLAGLVGEQRSQFELLKAE